MAIKLKTSLQGILLDIDGTLVNSRRELSPEMIKLIKQIYQKGIFCSLATGRHYASIKNYILPHFPKNSFHLTSCGAQIVNPSGKVFWQKTIDDVLAREVIKKTQSLGGAVIFGSGVKLFCPQSIYENLRHHPWQIEVEVYDEDQDYEFTLLSVVDINPRVTKYISSLQNLEVYALINSSGKKYFDLTAKGINKASGARLWCRQLGIKMENVLAIGDSQNDYELVKNVGYGVAMESSPEILKKVAAKVIGKNNGQTLIKFLTNSVARFS